MNLVSIRMFGLGLLVIVMASVPAASAWTGLYCQFTEDYEVVPGSVLNFDLKAPLHFKRGTWGRVKEDHHVVKHLKILESPYVVLALSKALRCIKASSDSEVLKMKAK